MVSRYSMWAASALHTDFPKLGVPLKGAHNEDYRVSENWGLSGLGIPIVRTRVFGVCIWGPPIKGTRKGYV